MALADRNLKAGQKLVARFKGEEHSVIVLDDPSTGGLGFELDGGTIYKSLSSAGSAVMGGVSCNGWRFWSLDGELKLKATPSKAKKSGRTVGLVRLIRRVPNQKGVPEGQTKWFCSGCMESFIAVTGTEPATCLKGHPAQDHDELIPLT